jgi:hypothetical protein
MGLPNARSQSLLLRAPILGVGYDFRLHPGSRGMVQQIVIRVAVEADWQEILLHRRAMFEDMGYKDEQALDAMRPLAVHS